MIISPFAECDELRTQMHTVSNIIKPNFQQRTGNTLGCPPSQDARFRLGSPILKMAHNPGGDWNPGRGDNPSNTFPQTNTQPARPWCKIPMIRRHPWPNVLASLWRISQRFRWCQRSRNQEKQCLGRSDFYFLHPKLLIDSLKLSKISKISKFNMKTILFPKFIIIIIKDNNNMSTFSSFPPPICFFKIHPRNRAWSTCYEVYLPRAWSWCYAHHWGRSYDSWPTHHRAWWNRSHVHPARHEW